MALASIAAQRSAAIVETRARDLTRPPWKRCDGRAERCVVGERNGTVAQGSRRSPPCPAAVLPWAPPVPRPARLVRVQAPASGSHSVSLAEEHAMHSVAKVSELSARSDRSFEDAIEIGIPRAAKTLRRIVSVWIKEQHVEVDNGKITGYRVNMLVTFVLED